MDQGGGPVLTRREIRKNMAIRKSQLRVLRLSGAATAGWLALGEWRVRCALGRSGLKAVKREGDGATPLGRFRLLNAYYRPDHLRRPVMSMRLRPLQERDGWCDATGDRNYNRAVRHPYPASAERMWRADGLYDVVVVLDYNINPRKQGGGSAIFLHCARSGYAPTEGCVAVKRAELVRLLARVPRRCTISI